MEIKKKARLLSINNPALNCGDSRFECCFKTIAEKAILNTDLNIIYDFYKFPEDDLHPLYAYGFFCC